MIDRPQVQPRGTSLQKPINTELDIIETRLQEDFEEMVRFQRVAYRSGERRAVILSALAQRGTAIREEHVSAIIQVSGMTFEQALATFRQMADRICESLAGTRI